jgi:hypothetical protein
MYEPSASFSNGRPFCQKLVSGTSTTYLRKLEKSNQHLLAYSKLGEVYIVFYFLVCQFPFC